MNKMKDVNSFKGLAIVFSNMLNGNYKKYYSGVRGAFRDGVYLFVRMVWK